MFPLTLFDLCLRQSNIDKKCLCQEQFHFPHSLHRNLHSAAFQLAAQNESLSILRDTDKIIAEEAILQNTER